MLFGVTVRARDGRAVALVAAAPSDAERVYASRREAYRELVERAFPEMDDAALRARFLGKWRAKGAYFLVCGGDDVGALETDEVMGAVFVRSIAIVPAAQGAGIGEAVLRALQEAASREGRAVTLSVAHPNARAAALYRRLGFVEERVDAEKIWMRWAPRG